MRPDTFALDLDADSCHIIVRALVTSLLNHRQLPVPWNYYKVLKDKLQHIQNRVAPLICEVKKREHIISYYFVYQSVSVFSLNREVLLTSLVYVSPSYVTSGAFLQSIHYPFTMSFPIVPDFMLIKYIGLN